jgi:phosphate:Na+ symporter
VSLEAAAAVVIGANVGTTVTAVLAAIGATSNAKRAAAAHILFNVLTGVVALLLLPWLLGFLGFVRELLDLDAAPAANLALFHTAFNVLGVILIWPLAERLTAFLLQRFKSGEEDEARPRYLDKTVLAVPALALDALTRELHRLGSIALVTVRGAFKAAPSQLERNRRIADQLTTAIADFITQLNRGGMAPESAQRLPQLLRVARYYESATELATEAAVALRETEVVENAAGADFRAEAEALLARLDPCAPVEAVDLDPFEAAYQRHKADLLAAGAQGSIGVASMDAQLRAGSAFRRALDQAVKALRLLGAGTATVGK